MGKFLNKMMFTNKQLYLMYLKENPNIDEVIPAPPGVTLPNDLIYDETTIPYIAIYYYNPKILYTNDVIIPFYLTDFYQREFKYDDTSLNFKLRYEIDGVVSYIENVKAGDFNLNLGKLSSGMHYYSIQVEDSDGRVSRRIFNDLYIIDETYEIKPSEIYTITDTDLTTYSINKNNSTIEEDMINNRVGLSKLFLDLQQQGYRKCILPIGTYRINRTVRNGTIENKDCPILIPTKFTVDMNGSTFKLNPYDDRAYGNIAGVENLMVRMTGCFDSHLINGTLEGDYFERKTLMWSDGTNAISGSNGEHNSTFYSYGSEFSSIDNITIKQTTGYNVVCGQSGTYGWGHIGKWVDNLTVINGIDTIKDGHVTSNLGTMEQELLDNKYIVASIWLAMGGLVGQYWDMDFHFYDENNNFIETIKVYQFTRCRIPTNSKKFRCTFKGTTEDIGNLSIHHMKCTRYFEIKNCNFIDNRTCSAPFQSQHLTYDNCKFTRSGQSITPCEIDLEDGWEQQQDIFIRNCEVLENIGTADIIDNSGINHVFENNKNMSYTLRYRVNGFTARNNIGSDIGITYGFMTGNTIRVYDNSLIGCTVGYTNIDFWGNEKVGTIIKNNQIEPTYFVPGIKFGVFKNCKIIMNGSSASCKIEKSEISIKGTSRYISGDIFISDSTFTLYEGQTISKFSFNAENVIREYTNCIYNTPVQFIDHNAWNTGKWKGCSFNENVEMLIANNSITNILGDITFDNCTFNKNVLISIKSLNLTMQFNNCTFNGENTFNYYGKANCKFNNCIGVV